MKSRSTALVALSVLLSLFVVGCGGSGSTKPFEVSYPAPPPPPPGGGDGDDDTTPPPAPPPAASFDADAFVHAQSALFGSFPSDLVLYQDTLFTTDADQVEGGGRWVVPLDASGVKPLASTRFLPFQIQAGMLVASDGSAANPQAPISFGFFLNDLAIVDDHVGFVLVNAGGSDSLPALSNLVVFDPTLGAVLQVVNLATTYSNGSFLFDSAGLQVPGNAFLQAGAEALEFVPGAPGQGTLFVAMTNFVVGAPSYGTVKYPGTVQVFTVDLRSPQPIAPIAATGLATETWKTQGYNPSAFARIVPDPYPGGGRPNDRLLVVVAGATGYDANGNLVPTTDASVETWDAQDRTFLGTFRLGPAGLAAARPGLGTDAAGHRVAFLPSATTGEVYLLLLDGLYEPGIHEDALAVLRGPNNGIPVAADQAGSPGGNVTSAALSPDGRTLVVCGFGNLFSFPPRPGRLYLLGLPEDLVTGSGFGANFTAGSTLFATVPGRALGQLVLDPGTPGRPDAFVAVSGPIDTSTYLGAGPASVGTFDSAGSVR